MTTIKILFFFSLVKELSRDKKIISNEILFACLETIAELLEGFVHLSVWWFGSLKSESGLWFGFEMTSKCEVLGIYKFFFNFERRIYWSHDLQILLKGLTVVLDVYGTLRVYLVIIDHQSNLLKEYHISSYQ